MTPELLNRNRGFDNEDELLSCFSDIFDLHIFYLYRSFAEADTRDENGEEALLNEFEALLSREKFDVAFAEASDEEIGELHTLREYFSQRRKAVENTTDLPLLHAAEAFSLDEFQFFALLSAYCCETNPKYEKIFAFLQNGGAADFPTVGTLSKLWAKPGERISAYYPYFFEKNTLSEYFLEIGGDASEAFCSKRVRLAGSFLENLLENKSVTFTDKLPREPFCLFGSVIRQMEQAASAPSEQALALFLRGSNGNGKRFCVKRCARSLGKNVLFLSAAELCAAEEPIRFFRGKLRAAIIHGASVCLTGFERLLEEENRKTLLALNEQFKQSAAYLRLVYITSEKRWIGFDGGGRIRLREFALPEVNEPQRLALWSALLDLKRLARDIRLEEVSAKFRFTAGQIREIASNLEEATASETDGKITSESLYGECARQTEQRDDLPAVIVEPIYERGSLVLPKNENALLKEICARVKYHHRVYEEWGFSKKIAYGKGVSALFCGPPGTGKTMAAQVTAKELSMRLFKVNLSQLVSKYIGETEKNLDRIFDEGRRTDCILFFDEADAVFGKRSGVSNAQDRHANNETAFLLQRLEEYEGVVIMATNLPENIDEAFTRRLSFIVNFPFPDEASRRTLWKKLLTANAPLGEDIDFDFLGDSFRLSGGEIKNCVIRAAFRAAEEGSSIGMRQLLNAAVEELRKNNTVVPREDLRQYADMVFGD